MTKVATHGMMDVARGTVSRDSQKSDQQSNTDNAPIRERFSQEGNPDKQIDKTLGSVLMRENLEQDPTWELPEIDLTSERLRKSSSMWPEIEGAVLQIDKVASEGEMLEKLGEFVRAITAPKFAAAYAKTAFDGNTFPHTHTAQAVWKTAVWNGTVGNPHSPVSIVSVPRLDEETWTKLCAAQVVFNYLSNEVLEKEAWQELVTDETERTKAFELCERMLLAGRCGSRG